MAMSSEDSSCPDDHDVSESELELGLGLSLACSSISFSATKRVQQATAAPPPSTNASKSSSSSSSCVSRANGGTAAGTKRTADSASQVVGWPPLRAHRINSMVNQAKSTATEEYGANVEKSKNKINTVENGINGGNKNSGGPRVRGQLRSSLFVKVNMDGCAIGRKVDLNAHSSYDTLAKTLENMFFGPTIITNSTCAGRKENGAMVGATKSSKLLNGSFDFVLTYEDKEGDWMMVGDVPWGMFINSVKRLRIMKTSEANGLDPRVQEYNERPRNKPF